MTRNLPGKSFIFILLGCMIYLSSVACQPGNTLPGNPSSQPTLALLMTQATTVTKNVNTPAQTQTMMSQELSDIAQSKITSTPHSTLVKETPTPISDTPQPIETMSVQTPTQYPPPWLLPDSEVIDGPSGADFDIMKFLEGTYGSFRDYQEWLASTGWTPAGMILQRVALENSINPRLLLALVEWSCHCILDKNLDTLQSSYFLGVQDFRRKGLYGQLSWAAHTLAEGYYAQRSEDPTSFEDLATKNDFPVSFQPDGQLNAGSVALQYFFWRLTANRESISPWEELPVLYVRMFGDPWLRDRQIGMLVPEDLRQPEMILPFEPGKKWSFTNGPHPAWENAGVPSALDFAPASNQTGCIPSSAWVVAVADGLVVRSAFGVVVQDVGDMAASTRLDDLSSLADGKEQTGWAVLYLHIAENDRVPAGQFLHQGERIGHPSCEGGPATGTHLHIARKYNGEWIAADGAVPFVLGGWTAHVGAQPYEGSLTSGEHTIHSSLYGTAFSVILRPKEGEVFP
jgi:LasA protease